MKIVGLRAVGYCRVSSSVQRDNSSIATQKQLIEEYAEKKGYQLLRFYVDDGFSGSTAKRKQYKQLFADAENKEFDVLLVSSYDRFGRKLLNFLKAMKTLEQFEVTFVSINQNIETVTPNGKFNAAVTMSVAEWEAETIALRTKEGKRYSARRGTFVPGRPPYGYIYKREDKNTIIEIDEEKSEVYHEIVKLYLTDHLSTTKVAEELTARGIPRPSGDVSVWAADQVGRILRCTAYAGSAEFFTKKYETAVNPDENPYPKRTNKPSGESITIKFPPLITQDKWNKIQQQIQFNKKKPKVNRRKHAVNTFLLGDVLGRQFVCGLCGSKMGSKVIKQYRSGNIAYQYQCSHHYQSKKLLEKRGHEKCPLRAVSSKDADQEAWDQIATMLSEPLKFFKMWARNDGTQRDSKSSRLKSLTKKLEKNKRQLDRTTDHILEAVDKNIIESYKTKQLKLSGEITKTEAEIQSVRREKHTTEDSVKFLQAIVEELEEQIPAMEKGKEGFLNSIYDALEKITDFQTRREILAAVVAPENGGSVELDRDEKTGFFEIDIHAKVNVERIASLFQKLQKGGTFKIAARYLRPKR